MKKMYKYKVYLMGDHAPIPIEAFVKLKDALALTELTPNNRFNVVPCHGPSYYISCYGHVNITVRTKQP